jgi:hypothetical protein
MTLKLSAFLVVFVSCTLPLTAVTQKQPAPASPTQQDAPDPSNQPFKGKIAGASFTGGGGFRMGSVAEVAADHFTIKEADKDYIIRFNAETAFQRNTCAQPISGQSAGQAGHALPSALPSKPSEVRLGDEIMAIGPGGDGVNSMNATSIFWTESGCVLRAGPIIDYAKTWLMGDVTAIEGTRIIIIGTVDHQAHSIETNLTTTFRLNSRPSALANLQVKDKVRIDGAVKDGAFVALSVTALR